MFMFIYHPFVSSIDLFKRFDDYRLVITSNLAVCLSIFVQTLHKYPGQIACTLFVFPASMSQRNKIKNKNNIVCSQIQTGDCSCYLSSTP